MTQREAAALMCALILIAPVAWLIGRFLAKRAHKRFVEDWMD